MTSAGPGGGFDDMNGRWDRGTAAVALASAAAALASWMFDVRALAGGYLVLDWAIFREVMHHLFHAAPPLSTHETFAAPVKHFGIHLHLWLPPLSFLAALPGIAERAHATMLAVSSLGLFFVPPLLTRLSREAGASARAATAFGLPGRRLPAALEPVAAGISSGIAVRSVFLLVSARVAPRARARGDGAARSGAGRPRGGRSVRRAVFAFHAGRRGTRRRAGADDSRVFGRVRDRDSADRKMATGVGRRIRANHSERAVRLSPLRTVASFSRTTPRLRIRSRFTAFAIWR
ncbi:MAG: hypothetical protein M5R36_26450 [Deltaproteobacteria bacterium]|nr:hypothetical protein [Deltaproteobacteria bacterium]